MSDSREGSDARPIAGFTATDETGAPIQVERATARGDAVYLVVDGAVRSVTVGACLVTS